jgi:hypothetical protein
VLDTVARYRIAMAQFAGMKNLHGWYARPEIESVLEQLAPLVHTVHLGNRHLGDPAASSALHSSSRTSRNRRRPAGLQRAPQRPQRPPIAALPRRDPGPMRLHRCRRWTALGGSAVAVADGPTAVA